jgi:gliding motility-associated-like protein
MNRIILFLLLVIATYQLKSQCFQIQSILVDACTGPQAQEGKDEMVIFQVGNTPLLTTNLSVNWPNNNWLGLTKNASTAANVTTVNSTIVGCGFLKEPTSNILPANAKVLLVTSSAWTPLAQSFAGLTDTLYIIFQTAGNTNGHFANYTSATSPSPLRTLSMTFSSPSGCTDAVTYNRTLLTMQSGAVGAQDGSCVEFSASGIPTYVNNGCQAPFIPLTVDAGSNKTICFGSSQTFTAVASGAYNFMNWSLGTGATGTFAPTNSLSTTYTPGVSETGTVKLYCTISKVCGTQTTMVKDSVLLTITPPPTVTINPSVVSICIGQSAIVQANSNTAVTYTWSTSAQTNTVSLNAAGVYTVNVSNVCGNASATVSVSTSAAPTLSIVPSSTIICGSGQTATLSVAGSTGTYTWSNGSSASTTTINTSGVYTASVSTSGCGTASASITISTSPLPTISISVPTTTVCSGSVLTFTANSSDGNYLWTGGATTQTVSVNTPSIIVTTTNACGSAQATQTLNIIPIPTVTLSTNAIALCSGQSATVQANSNTAVTYTWSTSANTNSVSLNSAGIYSVDVSNACGSASETVSVSFGNSPSVTAIASQTLLCSGQIANLSLSGSTGSYLWSNGATTATTSVSNSGAYTVTLTNSCGQALSSVSITALSNPTISIIPNSPVLCSGATVTLTAVGNPTNYQWNTGANTAIIFVNMPGVNTVSVSNVCGIATASVNVTSANFPPLVLTTSSNTICPNETATLTVTGGNSGPYSWSHSSSNGSVVTTNGGTITVTNVNACGTSTATIFVSVNPLNASISAIPQNGMSPLTVDFVNNSTNASTYLWDFGNGNSANTSTVSSQTYYNAGDYMAYLIVTNGVCMDIDSIAITVYEEGPTLYIPNAFTPNSDSINDIFYVSGTNIKEFNMIIFDRWGLKLFESSDIKTGWDGKVNGNVVADGTYFHLVKAVGNDGVEIKKQGTVTLFK